MAYSQPMKTNAWVWVVAAVVIALAAAYFVSSGSNPLSFLGAGAPADPRTDKSRVGACFKATVDGGAVGSECSITTEAECQPNKVTPGEARTPGELEKSNGFWAGAETSCTTDKGTKKMVENFSYIDGCDKLSATARKKAILEATKKCHAEIAAGIKKNEQVYYRVPLCESGKPVDDPTISPGIIDITIAQGKCAIQCADVVICPKPTPAPTKTAGPTNTPTPTPTPTSTKTPSPAHTPKM